MSRIGKQPITVPEGVEIIIDDKNLVTIKGPKGQLQEQINKDKIGRASCRERV